MFPGRPGRGPPGLHPRRSMQHERPFEFLFPRVELAQFSLKESQVEAQAGLRPFIPERESRRQRVRRHVTRLLEATELVTEQGTHPSGPSTSGGGGRRAGARWRRPLENGRPLAAGLAGREAQRVGPGVYGFDAQSVEGSGIAHGLHADLVPASRHHVEHVQAQLVDTAGRGDECRWIGPDHAADGVRLQQYASVGRSQDLRHVRPTLLDEHLQVLPRAQLDRIAMRRPHRRLALQDEALGQGRDIGGGWFLRDGQAHGRLARQANRGHDRERMRHRRSP